VETFREDQNLKNSKPIKFNCGIIPTKKNQNRPYTLNPKPKVLIKVELETVGQ
jgi:hypothetical protein